MFIRSLSCLVLALLGGAACGTVNTADPDGSPAEPQSLTVTTTGDGVIRSSPGGVDCGSKCISQFDAGTQVTLTPTPGPNSSFTGWSGDCTGEGACVLTMDSGKSVTASFAPHGSKRWVAQIGFSGQDSIEKIVVDPEGNLLAAGSIDAGAGTDLHVVKYAKEDGKIIWQQTFATINGGENLGGLATDSEGDVYLAARLTGIGEPVVYGTTTVTGDLFGNIVVLRLAAATGAVVWVKQWGGTGQDIPEDLAVSGGDLYVIGGTSSNPSTFDTKSIASATGNGFIVRANTATGAALELKHLPASISLLGIAVNGAHIGIAGQVRGALTLDSPCSVTTSGANARDALVIDLLGATLDCQWMRNYGDFAADNNATTHAIAPFPGGGWALAGSFQGSMNIAGSGASLTSRGGFDVFTARLDAAGGHLWSFRYGDTGFDVGYGISITPEGSVLLAGAFASTITFGTIALTGAADTFVTRMSSAITPTHEWAVGLGGNDYDLAEDVAVSPDGSVYVLSLFTGMTNVAGTALTSQNFDAWIAALVR